MASRARSYAAALAMLLLVACGSRDSNGGDSNPPSAVTGLTAFAGGGSGEVELEWDPLPAAEGVVFYRVYEQRSQGTAWQLAIVDSGWTDPSRGKVVLVDAPDYWPWPSIAAWSQDQRCYFVTAVSDEGLEGPRSAVACGSPPGG